MMPIRGLSSDGAAIHCRDLLGKGSDYFSAIMLCMWDNIHGPKILSVWRTILPLLAPTNSPSSAEASTYLAARPTNEVLISIAIHSLNNEPGRAERISGIESKFFALKKYNIIAGAFIFTIEVNPGRQEVFSFILVLPYSEMKEYLSRFSMYERKVHQLLKKHLIDGLVEMDHVVLKSQVKVKECVMKEVQRLDGAVLHFARLMHSLRYNFPKKVSITQTLLQNLEHPAHRKFLEHAITCHLQTSGHTIILGNDEQSVDMMLNTLALFFSEEERQLSRVTTSLLKDGMDGDCPHNYEPDLYLQGFVVSPDAPLPITWGDMLRNVLPPCIIHVNSREIWWVEKNIHWFIQIKDENEKKSKKCIDLKELSLFKEDLKEYSSRLVSTLIERMRLLPVKGGVRDSFIIQFLRHLKLKALTLAKYADADPKSQIVQAGEQLVGVLALNRGGTDKPRVSRESLQQDLSLECNGDLHIVLAFTEKIRSNTFIDVLGDPQSHSEAVIREFEAF